MAEEKADSRDRSRAGLCADCVHARIVESARSSEFYFCELSRTDAGYAKYPRLPVLDCPGHTPKPPG